MPQHAMRHPRVLTCLEIVRDPSEPSHRSAIRSIALFTVTRCRDDGPRFKVDHRAFDRYANRSEILEGIAARIPSDTTLIAKASPIDAQALRQAQSGDPLTPSDLQLIQRLRGDLDILPLQCRSSALDETAAAYAIRRAGPGASITAQARRAPDETVCVWLTFLWSVCRRTDRTMLGSAWEAWRAIENARPVGF